MFVFSLASSINPLYFLVVSEGPLPWSQTPPLDLILLLQLISHFHMLFL